MPAPASAVYSGTKAAVDVITRDDQIPLRHQDDAFVDDVIQALSIGPTALNTQRCSGDTSVPCTSAPGGGEMMLTGIVNGESRSIS